MSPLIGKIATGVAAVSLAVSPALAAQSSASKLSLRAATKSEDSSKLIGLPIIALIGVAAIVAAVVIISDDDDEPDSP